jgi:glycosyltransferase involved in cell wall biosynthesis
MTESLRSTRKVLVLAPSLKGIGGVQNYTNTFIDALREVLGHDRVRVVTVPEEAITRKGRPPALRTSAKIRFLITAFASAISWRPDLVIGAHVGLTPACSLIRKFTRTPYWVVLYGIEVWGDLTSAKRDALKSAARLVSITRFTLEATLKRHKLGEIPAVILPPTLPRRRQSPPSQSINESPSAKPQRPIVLTVGRMSASERYKGHDVMLEAWPSVLRRVPDAEYWIVGEGDDRKRLESKAQELGVAGSLHFAGSVSPEELALCYDRCRVFAMPARTELDGPVPRGEGFGIVFLEAMAFGKPVIGPQLGAPAEFIRSGEHGLLVDPASPAAVADAIVELLTNPSRAHEMGIAAKQWVNSEFSFESFCGRVREALAT